MDWERLRVAVHDSTARVADLLRRAPTGDVTVPGLTWSAGELGAHLVSVPRRYRRMLPGGIPFPQSLTALNETELREIGTFETTELADLLIVEAHQFMDALGADGDRPVPFFGMQHTAAGVAGILLGELLLHGLDLARALARPWGIRPDHTLAVTRGLLPTLPYVAPACGVGRASGTYHLHLRGGDDWSIVVSDDGLTVECSPPARADLHISAEPVTNLLVGYRRIPLWRAALTGRIVAWGRKPWLAVRFDALLQET
jgi:uncharacterized protein (TIGR03083 family)